MLPGFDKDGQQVVFILCSSGVQASATHDNEMKNPGGGYSMSFTIAPVLTGVMNMCRYAMLFPG